MAPLHSQFENGSCIDETEESNKKYSLSMLHEEEIVKRKIFNTQQNNYKNQFKYIKFQNAQNKTTKDWRNETIV
jgi:hypothetical protein